MEIKPIETEYGGYKFRSRLEARWAVFFDTAKIKYEYEPTVEATAAVVEEPVEVSVEEIPQEQVQADDFADLMNG
jgi:hypothetical protein